MGAAFDAGLEDEALERDDFGVPMPESRKEDEASRLASLLNATCRGLGVRWLSLLRSRLLERDRLFWNHVYNIKINHCSKLARTI